MLSKIESPKWRALQRIGFLDLHFVTFAYVRSLHSYNVENEFVQLKSRLVECILKTRHSGGRAAASQWRSFAAWEKSFCLATEKVYAGRLGSEQMG